MIAQCTLLGRTVRLEVRRTANGAVTVLVDGRPREVSVATAGRFTSLIVDGRVHDLGLLGKGPSFLVEWGAFAAEAELVSGTVAAAATEARRPQGPARVVAPMPGKVVRVLVAPGQEVASGQSLVVVEAMKMENEMRSPQAGRVLELPAREGQAVDAGALLAVVG
jgi:acetyl/propionyl-CoA carboxylase alpha subunit